MSDQRSPDYDEKRDEAATPPPLDPTGRVTLVLEPNEARAGTTKPQMWRVLTISLIGIVVLFTIVYFVFFPTPDGTQTALPPEETTLPDPAPPPAPTP
jgi:hypothetical protein